MYALDHDEEELGPIEFTANPHFEDYVFDWSRKNYFLVGGYGSSKSYHTAFKLLLKGLEEKRKMLVIREVYDTHRESTFSLFEELIELMDLEGRGLVKAMQSPMQIRFSNGSRIIFKGMDKPAKLKSINGISIVWLEECSEVKYTGFKELLGRLRHPTLSLHVLLSTNPVGKDNWSYKHFFKDEQKKRLIMDDQELYKKRIIKTEDTYYHHSTVDDNYYAPESYISQLDEMKLYDLDMYRIARKGRFGVNGIRVLPQLVVKSHKEVMKAINAINKPMARAGMDFGFVESKNAVLRMVIDPEKLILYVHWEYYQNGKTDPETAVDLESFKQSQELIIADSAEPKTIAYYRKQGFNMIEALKFPGSRLQNTKKIKRFRQIIISDACENTIYELKDLTFAKDKLGEIIEDEFNIDPHTFSAMWYGLDGYDVPDIKEETDKSIRKRKERRKERRKRG
ncbi:PBSX family phage terminase large subunit [Listeria booriae]|uniref:PBSX family phage terminase large subunit n=1 Tax=Listeria booriae TaxID=1552123 RepID=UPI00289FC064|nr:PBSX family phage terminase large subunit [Listeria booriae]